jgi:hypothetical protein
MKNLWGERPKDGNWSLIMILTGLLIGYHKQGRADMFGAKCAIETKATSFPGSSEVRFPNTFPDSVDLSKLPVSEKNYLHFPLSAYQQGWFLSISRLPVISTDCFSRRIRARFLCRVKYTKLFSLAIPAKSGRYRILKKPTRTGSSQPGACCSFREKWGRQN